MDILDINVVQKRNMLNMILQIKKCIIVLKQEIFKYKQEVK